MEENEDRTLRQPSQPPSLPKFQPYPEGQQTGDVHAGDTIIEKTPPSSVTPGSRTPPSATGSRSAGVRPSKSEPDPTPPEAKAAMLDPARRINQYVLIQQVGQGGMGSVWKAWDTKLARYIAVKFLNATEEESVRRFQREAQLAARLRHPNIATIYEVNETRGVNFLVMDFIDGASIGKANLSLPKIIEAFIKVCRSIEYAHKNTIIHRDIKPQNIMVNKEGEPFVTDFGLAKVLSAESSISIAGAVLGTPAYMPPEQATGKIASLDGRSDIYSLGATLYMLATGHVPFEADNATALLYKVCSTEPERPRKVNPKVPQAVEAIILKAMEKDKRNRYATAGEMADDLQRHLNNQPIAARPPGLVRTLVRHIGAVVKVVAVVVIVLVVVGGAVVLIPKVKSWFSKDAEWVAQYDRLRERFKFEGFKPLSEEEANQAQQAIKDMPKGRAEEVAAWFDKTLDERVPAEVWDARLWPDHKEEAEHLVAWCTGVQTALQGITKAVADKFKNLEGRLSTTIERFKPVADYVEDPRIKEWKTRFDGLKLSMVYSTFQSLPPERVKELNKVLKEVPEPALADDAAAWFDRHSTDNLPPQVWDKGLWPYKREEAVKIVDWCKTVRALIEGLRAPKFKALDERLDGVAKAFQEVVDFKGDGSERLWKARFDDVQLTLRFTRFQAVPEANVEEMRKVIAEMPESLADWVAKWFTDEADGMPQQVWDRPLWPIKKDEAEKIVKWCSTVRRVLAGVPKAVLAKFKALDERLERVSKAFQEVVDSGERDPERLWKPRFEPAQLALVYETFNTVPEAKIDEMKKILGEMPESLADWVAKWFTEQADRMPERVWPKPLWSSKKEEAGKIVGWCSTVRRVLAGAPKAAAPKFKALDERLEKKAKEFDEVWKYRESDPERVWKQRFENIQVDLVYQASFRPLPDARIEEMKKVAGEMPESLAEGVAEWFTEQAKQIPERVWDKALWVSKKEEAGRIVGWCSTVRRVLAGVPKASAPKFKALDERLEKTAKAFQAVVDHKVSDVEQKWQRRFDGIQVDLVYERFRTLPDAKIEEMKKVFAEMPESLADGVAEWFTGQAKQIPEKVWDKALWEFKKDEAGRIVDWCGAVRRILAGIPKAVAPRFKALDERLASSETAFRPVKEYKGPVSDREWLDKFERLQVEMVLLRFHPVSDARIEEMKKVLAEMPDSQVDDAANWFGKQAANLPDRVWAKSLWLDRKDEARKFVDWSSAVRRVLAGVPAAAAPKFKSVLDAVAAAAARFAPVVAFRGNITLKIYILPDAEVKSFRVGEQWVIKDGKKVESDAARIGETVFFSPLVIESLDIGDYALTVDLGGKVKDLKISGESLRDGASYVYGGDAERPEAMKLRRVR